MPLSHLCQADHLSLLSPPLYPKPTVGACVLLRPKMFAGLICKSYLGQQLTPPHVGTQVIEIIRLCVMEERGRRAGQRVARDKTQEKGPGYHYCGDLCPGSAQGELELQRKAGDRPRAEVLSLSKNSYILRWPGSN